MDESSTRSAAQLLLTHRGLVCVRGFGDPLPQDLIQTVELELADSGYVLSPRLRDRLRHSSLHEVGRFRKLAAESGVRYEPLFRDFPHGIPENTAQLWWSKVLVHFLQAPGQPCLFCRKIGTTHVLSPCRHVVCDHCFDGSNYSACPVCEHKVDRSSPFFLPAKDPERPPGSFRFSMLDLGESLESECRQWFVSLCERKQALSPRDQEALTAITRQFRKLVLEWLPAAIPLRENIATILGSLLARETALPREEVDSVLHRARSYLSTATDVLRTIAVLSGADGSLTPSEIYRDFPLETAAIRFRSRIANWTSADKWRPYAGQESVWMPLRVRRFKVAKLTRGMRRAFLAMLDALPAERLTEDMLRHRPYWVGVGEFLHPGEFAARYPNAARAFAIVRGKSPDGTPAPPFETWNSRLESALQAGQTAQAIEALEARPGELARRVDLLLRTAPAGASLDNAIAAVNRLVHAFATPVLLTLLAHFRTRHARARVRAYWPKGQVAVGALGPDRRDTIPPSVTEPVLAAIRQELLRRFASKPAFEQGIIDRELRNVIVPFNERTSSASSVPLPRGSTVEIEPGKLMRLFLHWCQPETGFNTDLDLSVAFYHEDWRFAGRCAYYELRLDHPSAGNVALSAGDSRNAPFPDGATEFVDIHRDTALRADFRYAVMVVNAYSGMPFDALERGFAGLMLRDTAEGWHFDPRSVEWKFTLRGQNGIFMPLVYDMRANRVHWLDVQSAGEFELNNVETSKRDLARICPRLIQYFASGTRPSMWDLGLLHLAARCQRVLVRDRGLVIAEIVRQPAESPESFLHRIRDSAVAGQPAASPIETPVLAFLYRGDLDPPAGSIAYALFREGIASPAAAADFLS